MESNIYFKLSRIGQKWFIDQQYQIQINGEHIGFVDHQHPTLRKSLPSGKYLVEIKSKNGWIVKKIFLNSNQLQTVLIKPSMSLKMIQGIIWGMILAISALLFLEFDYKLIQSIALLICIISLFTQKPTKSDFDVSVSKLAFTRTND